MTDYKSLEKYLRYKLKGYRDNLEFEDGIQEGLIRAWKDTETGTYDENHTRNRALSWAHNFLYKDTQYATGDQGRSREGITKHSTDATREKVKAFQDQHRALHGEVPTNAQVSQGTGLSVGVARYAAQTLKTQNQAKPTYYVDSQGKNRLDVQSYKKTPLYATVDGEEFLDVRVENVYHFTWESTLVDDDAFRSRIAPMDDRSKALLTLTHVYGYTHPEIGKILGMSTSAVYRGLNAAHKLAAGKISKVPAPPIKKECATGGLHAPGVTGRSCKFCKRDADKRYRDKRKLRDSSSG